MLEATIMNPAEFAQRVLSQCLKNSSEEAQITHTQSDLFEINFENGEINLVRTTHNLTTQLTLFSQGRKGTATFNGLEDSHLNQAMQAARQAMQASVADPANTIATSPSQPAFSKGPEHPEKETMVQTIQKFFKDVKAKWPKLLADSGSYTFHDSQIFFINSANVIQQDHRRGYSLGVKALGKDGSQTTSFNYAGLLSYQVIDDFFSVEPIARMLKQTHDSLSPQHLPHKFTGTLLLTPESVGDLTSSLTNALSGYELLSATTPYKDSLNDVIATSSLNLKNSPLHPEFLAGSSFDSFGVPSQNIDVIKEGLLKNYLIDFFCSRKLSQTQTSGAVNLVIAPGDTSLEQIIAQIDQGVLMTRFSGGKPNNNLDFSGVAKNSFYIEKGQIKYPLIETMVSGNFAQLIQNISGISKEFCNNGSRSYPYISLEGAVFSSE